MTEGTYYKILFSGLKREKYLGEMDPVRDDFTFSEDVFKNLILPKLPTYDRITSTYTCTRFKKFFETTGGPELLKRLHLLSVDLRDLHLRKPFYTIDFLEDIQSFRELNTQQKKVKICEIFNVKEEAENESTEKTLWTIITNWPNSQNSLGYFDCFYQGYKEKLFNQELIQGIKNININRAGELFSFFLVDLAKPVTLSLLREKFATVDQFRSFLSNDKSINFSDGQFGNEEHNIGSHRLDYLMCDKFLNEIRKGTTSIEKIMDIPYSEIQQLYPVQLPAPLNEQQGIQQNNNFNI